MPLYCVTVHAYKRDCRNGRLRVLPGVATGPLVAATPAEVEQYAAGRVRALFPAPAGWEGHAYTISDVPEGVVSQAALELGYVKAPGGRKRARREQRGAGR